MKATAKLERQLKPETVAEILGVSVHTLRQWRCDGCGPRLYKLKDQKQAAVRYCASDVSAWIEARRAAAG